VSPRRLAGAVLGRPTRTCGVIGALFVIVYLAAVLAFPRTDERLVVGDAVHHFVQLRSLVYDGDLQFRNEYVRLYGLGGADARADGDEWIFDDLTVTGHVRNYSPVGPALIWAPLYGLLSAVLWIGAGLGLNATPTGYEPLLQLAPGLTGIAAATGAAVLAARLAARWTTPEWATAGTVGIWLGSPAIYYSLVSPSYSHAPSMLAMALYLLVWAKGAASPAGVTGRWCALTGFLSGLASLMRWQDALGILLALYVVAVRPDHSLAARARHAALVLAGWVVAFLPQMAVWQVLYGSPLTMPQGAGFMEWTAPNPVAVLFSANHGLFTWTPVLLPAVAGAIALSRRDRRVARPLVILAVAAWWVNASVADWWAGEAFGARRFLSLFAIFAPGLSVWMAEGRRWRRWLTAALVGANALLLLQYQVFMKGLIEIAPYPYEWFDLWLARFAVPFRIIARWIQ
jgi:hypothetical protein